MKISLNRQEALKIVTDYYQIKLPYETLQIEITSTIPMLDASVAVLDKISNMTYLGYQKIEAIKLLRAAVSGMGLFDAKCAIENFPKYRLQCEAVGYLIDRLNSQA